MSLLQIENRYHHKHLPKGTFTFQESEKQNQEVATFKEQQFLDWGEGHPLDVYMPQVQTRGLDLSFVPAHPPSIHGRPPFVRQRWNPLRGTVVTDVVLAVLHATVVAGLGSKGRAAGVTNLLILPSWWIGVRIIENRRGMGCGEECLVV